MDLLDPRLVGMVTMAVLAVGTGLAALGYRWADARAVARRPAGPACPACGEAAFTAIHPQAWRCDACGAEWGPGWDRRRDEQELLALASLSPDEAVGEVRRRLADAATLLVSAEGPIRTPIVHRDKQRIQWNMSLDEALADLELVRDHLRVVAMLDPERRRALQAQGVDPEEPVAPHPGSIEQVERWSRAVRAAAAT